MQAIEILTKSQEQEILRSKATRKLVHEVLALAEKRDICDALADLELVATILNSRLIHSI